MLRRYRITIDGSSFTYVETDRAGVPRLTTRFPIADVRAVVLDHVLAEPESAVRVIAESGEEVKLQITALDTVERLGLQGWLEARMHPRPGHSSSSTIETSPLT